MLVMLVFDWCFGNDGIVGLNAEVQYCDPWNLFV